MPEWLLRLVVVKTCNPCITPALAFGFLALAGVLTLVGVLGDFLPLARLLSFCFRFRDFDSSSRAFALAVAVLCRLGLP